MTDQFVSRGGEKLEFALQNFKINVNGKICADLGASTGGFTDCLLQNNAGKVYAVETGYGTLDWKIRQNPKVVVMERTNALFVKLPELIDFIAIDLGWTKQKNILPVALKLLKNDGNIISLLKPHYEAMDSQLKKGKLPAELLPEIIDQVKNELQNLGISITQIIESPILGQKGKNTEYLLWIKNVRQ